MGRRSNDLKTLYNEKRILEQDLDILVSTKAMLAHHVTPRRLDYIIDYAKTTIADIENDIKEISGQARA